MSIADRSKWKPPMQCNLVNVQNHDQFAAINGSLVEMVYSPSEPMITVRTHAGFIIGNLSPDNAKIVATKMVELGQQVMHCSICCDVDPPHVTFDLTTYAQHRGRVIDPE